MKDFILKLTRHAIEIYVRSGKIIPKPKEYPKELSEKHGVFVTLFKKPRELRGCIGLPFPEKPLIEGIIEAAVDVCQDPRFPPLDKDELKDVFIEVSILSEPKLIKGKSKDCKKCIELGKDGLIIKRGYQGGLFLPQVPVEQGWNLDEYLENLCYKAGMSGDAWKDEECEIFKFQTEVFSEE